MSPTRLDEITAPAPSSILHRSLKEDPVTIDRAEGCYLYDDTGRAILDASGGPAVVCIGYGRERLAKVISSQVMNLSYLMSFRYTNKPAEDLSRLLTKDVPFEKVVYYCSGSEALEATIKLTRQYHVEQGQPGRVNFIARDQSYHGNTLGSLSLSRHTARRAPYLPLLGVPFHGVSPCYAYRGKLEDESDKEYVARLEAELEAKFQELGPETVAGFYAETVSGATLGCVPFVPGYLAAMRRVCHKHGALFVLDEIMCGMGKTGKLHAWQHEGDDAAPDIQAVAKTLTSGYAALSAVLVSAKVVDGLASGMFNNGHTFQNQPVACAAALEVQTIIQEEGL